MLLAGSRFIIAGIILWMVLSLFGRFRATYSQWRDNFFIGAFMLLGGNSLAVWAEQEIPSGVATLIISLNSIFVVAAEWILVTKWWKRWFRRVGSTDQSLQSIADSAARPSLLTIFGLVLGVIGLLILVWPSLGIEGAGSLPLMRVLALIAACVSWTIGSLANRGLSNPADPFSGAAMQMLGGGMWLTFVGLLLGETQQWSWTGISFNSWLAWSYLLVAGSLIAFTTFIWLMKHCSATTVSTYAYVNPIVAVLLGWWILAEEIDARVLLAAAIIIGAVAIITISKQKQAKAAMLRKV